jgi:hypothetical protein
MIQKRQSGKFAALSFFRGCKNTMEEKMFLLIILVILLFYFAAHYALWVFFRGALEQYGVSGLSGKAFFPLLLGGGIVISLSADS